MESIPSSLCHSLSLSLSLSVCVGWDFFLSLHVLSLTHSLLNCFVDAAHHAVMALCHHQLTSLVLNYSRIVLLKMI